MDEAQPPRTFEMKVLDVFSIKGSVVKTVVTGVVNSGTINLGDPIRILSGDAIVQDSVFELHVLPDPPTSPTSVSAGQNAGIALAHTSHERVRRGDLVVHP